MDKMGPWPRSMDGFTNLFSDPASKRTPFSSNHFQRGAKERHCGLQKKALAENPAKLAGDSHRLMQLAVRAKQQAKPYLLSWMDWQKRKACCIPPKWPS